ncbi:MAG: KamA family radical SAM protein [Candidatus Diapherotrites archaeon]|nr:KamA family radical SAM protein [Candidatus Diapherotrites archaeon]
MAITKQWQEELENCVTAKTLLQKSPSTAKALGVTQGNIEALDALYPIRITPHFAGLIDWSDPADPLLRMVFPTKEEFSEEGYSDTSGEKCNTKLKGLQHKYEPTALVQTTDTCASYCRYCFRRRNVGKKDAEAIDDFAEVVEYVKAHPEMDNVLLSGGDPLTLSNQKIDEMLAELREIPHVKLIRLGTRVLTYLPSRITTDPGLVEILAKHSTPDKKIYVIAHFDHPRELSPQTIEAVDTLLKSGVRVYNQAVMLRGINDDPKTLQELFERMVEVGITPYYLFQCRPVRGATHFHVPLVEGSQLFEDAKREMRGIPKTARYAMSTKAGKIEIVRVFSSGGKRHAFLKFISAKNKRVIGELMQFTYEGDAYWMDDILKKDYRYHGSQHALAELKKEMLGA